MVLWCFVLFTFMKYKSFLKFLIYSLLSLPCFISIFQAHYLSKIYWNLKYLLFVFVHYITTNFRRSAIFIFILINNNNSIWELAVSFIGWTASNYFTDYTTKHNWNYYILIHRMHILDSFDKLSTEKCTCRVLLNPFHFYHISIDDP